MADVQKQELPKAVQDYKAQQAQQRKATRAANRRNEVQLNAAGRLALDLVRSAGRSCDVLASMIKEGKPVSPDVLNACGLLSSAAGSLVATG